VLAGRYLMRIRAPADPWPPATTGTSLADVLRGRSTLGAQRLGFEISFGTIDGGHWRIERSTLPQLEGQALACEIERTAAGEARSRLAQESGNWQILEWEMPGDVIA